MNIADEPDGRKTADFESEVSHLEELNTIDEVAAFAKVSRRTVERAIKTGRIEVFRPSPRRPRISKRAVWEWLAQS